MNRFASDCGPFLVDLVVNPNPSDIGCFASSSKKSWSLVLRYCGFCTSMTCLFCRMVSSKVAAFAMKMQKIINKMIAVVIMTGLNNYTDT